MSDAYTWDNDVPEDNSLDDIDFNTDDTDYDDEPDEYYDDSIEDISTDNSEDNEQDYDISDDDIVVVMEDGSYIVIPYTTFEKLIQDGDFSNQLDEGFSDIDSFQNITSRIINEA